MTIRLSDHEGEVLSAYLDSVLSPDERSQVETRIKEDADYRAAYISLVRTRGILRAVPSIKRRRNFYLKPEMVRSRGWLWLIPAMNYSSAAAALLAVIFFMLDIFPISMKSQQIQNIKEESQLVQSTMAVAVSQPNAMEATPIQKGQMDAARGVATEEMLDTAVTGQKYSAESMATGQPPEGEQPSLSPAPVEEPQNQIIQSELLPPAAAAAMPGRESARPPESGSGMGFSGGTTAGEPLNTPTTAIQPTSAPAMKVAPAESVGAGAAITVPTTVEGSNPQALPSEAKNPPKAEQTTNEIVVNSQVPAPLLVRPSASPQDVLKPEKEKESPAIGNFTWPAFAAGGMFLLISFVLGATGFILGKRSRP